MFKIAKRALGAVEPFEYLPSDAQLALGSAATLGSGGKLAQGCFIPGDEHQFRRMGGQRSGKRFPEAG